MIAGAVDRSTGNVPLRLDGGYAVHFVGRDEGDRLRARLARSTSGPVRTFVDAVELHSYVFDALPPMYARPTVGEVSEWVDLRLAECVSS